MTRTFTATIVPAGNATGVEVPPEVVEALQDGRRPKVAITIGGHTWRSRVATKDGRSLIGISAANRAAAGIGLGDRVEVRIQLDTEPRVVAVPEDLAAELERRPGAREAFERLPYGLRRKHVAALESAKSADTRERRLARLVVMLEGTGDAG